MGDERSEEDFGPGRPVVSDASVRTICRTVVVLAMIAGAAVFMVTEPDQFVKVMGGLAALVAFLITVLAYAATN